jgi:membrane protease YdiL (CAAX protease family)
MPHLNFKSASPAAKLLITIFSIATIGSIIFFTGILLGRIIFWMHLDRVNDVLYGRYDMLTNRELRYFQIIQSIAYFIVPGYFLNWIFTASSRKYFNIYRPTRTLNLFLVVGILIIGIPFINWLIEVNKNFLLSHVFKSLNSAIERVDNNYTLITGRLLTTDTFGIYLFNILMIAILPAFGEELIFRGVLQKLFNEATKNIHISVFITALIFSVIHGQFFGILPRFVLGIFLGYLMVWSKSLWLPIFAHFTNNAIIVTMLYFQNNYNCSFDFSLVGMSAIIILFSSIILAGLLIYVIRKSILKYPLQS